MGMKIYLVDKMQREKYNNNNKRKARVWLRKGGAW